ncbi:hypothetical protein NEOLEDRAFT_1158303 [Neolentinus lepideus HHB14362 ss-1]|uniref:Large ribosomal subunit protein uL23m n=1 Tax=Neolentinus lepideus HHB14362 ss-1 TaxID=1314782 RepID=A0A165PKE6_9AGAM|nr:hypothetical protein NEOLEDRAFT_1158303 [Neolentinus lepideus HHB14362 ss-1]
MQAFSKCFTRSYATLPSPAKAARTASTPRAVRIRRSRKRTPSVAPGFSDALPSGATPTEHDRYTRLRALGEMVTRDGSHEYTEEEWLDKMGNHRTRIRGIVEETQGKEQGKKKIVGQRVYLPNVVFRMVRNHTPPGQAYNPYEATFRVSQSVTKTDIRSYLWSVYGVKTTYIRTDNYLSPLYRDPRTTTFVTKSYKTYKRAVVGLVDPFYYPRAVEDMNQRDRETRQKWLEDKFAMEKIKDYQHFLQLRMTRKNSSHATWRWSGVGPNRAAIIRKIGLARAEREAQIENNKKLIMDARASGKSVPEAFVLSDSGTETA